MSLDQSQQFYEILDRSQNPLIIFGKDHNGDTIGSSLALSKLIKKFGKDNNIIAPNFYLPKTYEFLPDNHLIKNELNNHRKFTISLNLLGQTNPQVEHQITDDQLHLHIIPEKGSLTTDHIYSSKTTYKHDLIITLNTPDLESLAEIFFDNPDFFYEIPIINIDHQPENENYGQLNIINLKATSISEIIYSLIEKIDLNLIDGHIATSLLTGMIEKTKSFKISSITPQTLNIASQLIALGAERDHIIKNLYQTKTVNTLKLWGRALQKLNGDQENKIVWLHIQNQDFLETSTNPENLFGLIDELIVNIPTVELITLFFTENDQTYCLIKSEKQHNLKYHFAEYNPVGENKSTIKFPYQGTPQKIIEKANELI